MKGRFPQLFSKKVSYPYVVTLKQSHLATVNLIGSLSLLMSASTFLFVYFIETKDRNGLWPAAAVGILLIWAWNQWQKKQSKPQQYKIGLLLAAITWASMPYARWMGLLMLILFLLEATAKKPVEIGFGIEEIVINEWIPRRFQWSELEQVVLKDNLLTLDFRNNRLFQKEVLEEEDAEAGEDEFNEFCAAQLNRPSSPPA